MPAFPGTAMSVPATNAEQNRDSTTESPAGARYRQAHGDAMSWAAHDYEVYYDLARAMPFPDLGPGETR
ncbi:hypothetical protein ABZ502_02280 [Streptomyces abikoensis]|uniref:Uncharacterized protein n=1 Tax=Streptomyces albireticuli TaxID=1940 RepID=A0A1Z2KXE3_9ACTN|nr:hypothetical protein [Streptomyces albireticuli]ARZ66732.1 hypothetical protein SMD11_1068 [Streptomyces albireticuli]